MKSDGLVCSVVVVLFTFAITASAAPGLECANRYNYKVVQSGTYNIVLESKTMGGMSDASLCVEKGEAGLRPAEPCIHIQDWHEGYVWKVNLLKGNYLTVWATEGNGHASGNMNADSCQGSDTGPWALLDFGYTNGFRLKVSVE